MNKEIEALEKLSNISIFEENVNSCSELGHCCDYRGDLDEVYEKEFKTLQSALKGIKKLKKENKNLRKAILLSFEKTISYPTIKAKDCVDDYNKDVEDFNNLTFYKLKYSKLTEAEFSFLKREVLK